MAHLLLSIDSGGSKTLCSILTSDGEMLGWGMGLSHRLQKEDSAKDSYYEAVSTALRKSGKSAEQISLCAISILGHLEALNWAMNKCGIQAVNSHFPDAHVALVASLCQDFGIVALSGTGSFVYGRSVSGENQLIGGLGYLLGDEGSGFDIGWNGLRAAIRWLEGWGEETLLAEQIELEWMGEVSSQRKGTVRSRKLLEFSIEDYPLHHLRKIAQISPIVGRCAAAGDRVARRIIEDAGTKMGIQTAALCKDFDTGLTPVPVGCAGGNWKIGKIMVDAFKKALENRMSTEFVIVPQKLEPLFGVSLLGMRQLGVEWDEPLLVKLKLHNMEMSTAISS